MENVIPVSGGGWEKKCEHCGGKFLTKNKKKKFCNPHHKHAYHYEKQNEEMKNKLDADRIFKASYKAIQTCYERGWYEVTPEVLVILGFNRSMTSMAGIYEGQKALFYSDYALVAGKNNKLKILKMSSWRNSKI